ncbi:sulfatase-like hydrolase/transferase [Halovivax cerinus]|uniref:Sulfatase-like hydrolase/transferase n=1 Tax=Halovivax cerinus TaxID=1487865 RepID=A0ABD5NJD9_9EURY|nr:sulfatase-like hydrolase/transferase [Halovivax cerinus]
MNVKRTLIDRLPPGAKRLLAVPYDWHQTREANKIFATKRLPRTNTSPDAPRHIVCVVVDALRADHITPELTPFLTDYNRTDAITPASWTFPAMSSFVTGMYPNEHGAMKQIDEPEEGLTLPPTLPDDRTTVTEALAGAGYETYGGFGHDTPFVALSGRFATHELYHSVTANADDVLGDHARWINGRERTFSLLHLADPHIPVDPPAEYWDRHDVDETIEEIKNWRYNSETDCDEACERYRDHRRRLYRASIEYVDDAIARYVDQLDEVLDERPLLVVTADHGEAMWEHVDFDVEHFDGTGCVDHGGAAYDELARVPLVTNRSWPLDGPVSLIDVAPTILDAVDLDTIETSGISLRKSVPPERQLLFESSLNGYEKKAVFDGEYKLLVSHGDDVDVTLTNPGDAVAEVPSDRLASMREILPPWPGGSDDATDVSGVVEDRLAKLGYK